MRRRPAPPPGRHSPRSLRSFSRPVSALPCTYARSFFVGSRGGHEAEHAERLGRRDVEDVRLGIERAAGPVRSAAGGRHRQRGERTLGAADDRRREDRTELVARRDLLRFGAQLRREVDQIVDRRAPASRNAGGFVGNGCVGEYHSPGTSPFSTGRSSIGQIGSPVTRSKT